MKRYLVPMLVLAVGCGPKARYIDPDAKSSVEGTGIESRDVRSIVFEMTQSILENPVITGSKTAPRMAVMPVENRTRFLIDQDIFTAMISDQIISGAAGRIAVVNRDLMDQIMQERKMKSSGVVDSQGPQKALAGVDYFLEGELHSLSASTNSRQSDYVVARFQLTDSESGVVVWSQSFEMKKEGSWGVMYQ